MTPFVTSDAFTPWPHVLLILAAPYLIPLSFLLVDFQLQSS